MDLRNRPVLANLAFLDFANPMPEWFFCFMLFDNFEQIMPVPSGKDFVAWLKLSVFHRVLARGAP